MKHSSFLLGFALVVVFTLTLPLGGSSFMMPSAWAQRMEQSNFGTTPVLDEKIAAIVNDSVISTFDLNQRIRLAILSSGLPDTSDVHQRLVPQIMRGLIDEQLELQEAKRLEINVTKDEIDSAFTHIALDNHIEGDMRSYLTQNNASPEALASQIRATIAWSKVIQRELRPRVEIGDDEIDAMIERIRANAGKEEYATSEIFLAVDSPKDEDQVHQFSENLVQQLKTGGNFSAAAHQFSQSSSAAVGGDIGWIEEGQLSPELDKTLSTMQAGEIKGPIRAASGYYILAVRDKRTIALGEPSEVTLDLQQIFHAISPTTNPHDLENEADKVRSDLVGCANLSDHLAQKFPEWRWQKLGNPTMTKLPSWIADKVRTLPVGKASASVATDKGILLFYVCERKTKEGSVNRDAVANVIGTEKLELQARRLLRDLHRTAYVDVRFSAMH